jgi:hypothetical protein
MPMCVPVSLLAFYLLAGPPSGQQPNALAPLAAKIRSDFEELARARTLSGTIERIDWRKRTLTVRPEGGAERLTVKFPSKPSVWVRYTDQDDAGQLVTREARARPSRLKEGERVTVYYEEKPRWLVRVEIDHTRPAK